MILGLGRKTIHDVGRRQGRPREVSSRRAGVIHARQKSSPCPDCRLGVYTCHSEDVVAVLMNPLSTYQLRPFEETDRDAVDALGSPVVGWWHGEPPGASLHLVAETSETGEIVGHLQARDRSVPEPSRRPD